MNEIIDYIRTTEFYKTRPVVIQKAMEIWLPNSNFIVNNEKLYLVGYSETERSVASGNPYDIMLILSKFDPKKEYKKAIENVEYICAEHFKED